ncbi:MAG: Crp/Fnr family transcriptional regulator [Litoreibacter sp.]|uniref:Crp/Fnr family transcriptional regulator n=1 Tax=Litoreibacter sp. TaxID=1969459 RepID=UPI0032995BEB
MKNSDRFPSVLDAKIFRGLTGEYKNQFIDSCGFRKFRRGEIVLPQGEQTDKMLMVAEGRVEISYISETGHKTIIYHAFVGNVLGFVETLSERACAGTCTALTDTNILTCKRSALYEHMQNPVFIRNFAEDLHDVLVHDNLYKSIDQFYTAEQKVCVYLEKLSASDGTVVIGSQSYLADVIGCTRQTVNKELGRLRDQGIIEITKTGVLILDYSALSNRLTQLSDTQKESKRGGNC